MCSRPEARDQDRDQGVRNLKTRDRDQDRNHNICSRPKPRYGL